MGPGVFLTRFFVGFGVTLAVAGVAVGCAGRQSSGDAWATPRELAWLEKLGTWNARLTNGLDKAARIEASPRLSRLLLQRDGQVMYRYEQALRPALTCRSDLLTNVGAAPSERLADAFDAFRAACKHLEHYSTAVGFVTYQPEDTAELRRARAAAARAQELLIKADQLVPPGEVRELPVTGGDTAKSRIEPRFGRIASALARKAVEVRCWSRPDWRRLMREERIYTRGKINADLLGFAGVGGRRVNLAPEPCEGLADLAYNRARPTDEANRLYLASAVVVLSHEAQHSKGIEDEAVAECAAIHAAEGTALRLGVGREYARRLVRTYWQHYDEEPAQYRTRACHWP